MKKIYKSVLVSLFMILIGTASATNISGDMLYLNDPALPIPNVVVSLKNLSTNTTFTCITDEDGHYAFQNVPAGDYKLSASTSNSSYEIGWESAWMVLSYLAGQTTLTDIQFLAADVNGNGKVKLNDFVLIVNHLLHGTPFPIGEWVFEEYYFSVDGTKDTPGGMSGSSAGDLTGVFVPGGRDLPAFPVEHNTEIAASANDEFTVSLTTCEALNLTGAGLTFNYPSNLMTIESVEFANDNFQYSIEENQLRLVWYDETDTPMTLSESAAIATLHCRTTAAFGPGNEANISLDGSSSLAGTNYTKVVGAKLGIPTVTYATPSLRISNYPNPFSGATTLSYYLPEDGNATVKIYFYSGQLLMNTTLSGMSAGYQQLEIDATHWTPGNYICQIQCEGSKKYIESRILIKTN
jgi:hypothetical protein